MLAAVTGHAVIGVDRGGTITLFNAGAERMLGWSADEVVGRRTPEVFLRRDELAERAARLGVEPGIEVFVAPLATAETDSREWTYVRRDGTELPVQVTVSALRDADGEAEGFIGVAADITRRKRTERRLRDEVDDRTHLATVARGLDSATDARTQICASALELADGRLAALMEPHGRELVLTASAGLDVPRLRVRRDTERSGTCVALDEGRPLFVADAAASELVSRRLVERTGAASVLYQPVLDGGDAIGVLVVTWGQRVERLADRVAARIALLADEAASAIRRADHLTRLDRLAHVDALTGAANRRAWELHAPVLLERSEPGRTAIALLDLDRFKAFNDRHGHQAGDELLRAAAHAWSGTLRDGDLLARYGGEEFAVALPGCSAGEARLVLDRLRAATPEGATVSAGVACWNGSESLTDVVARADAALYEAKRTGRDRLVAAG